MAVQIGKPTDSGMVKVVETGKEDTFTPSAMCKFGFDGDEAWVMDLYTGEYILKDDVANIDNLAGDLADKTRSGIETYFLTFIGL